MILKKFDKKVCAFCKKSGEYLSPILLKKIQIESVNVFGTEKELCTTCKNKFNQALQEKYIINKLTYSDRGLHYLRKLIQSVNH